MILNEIQAFDSIGKSKKCWRFDRILGDNIRLSMTRCTIVLLASFFRATDPVATPHCGA